MGRGEVAENQRHRMYGAMVEAVAANGYGGTSVKQVVSLAGVSRRAFYEQFANKQECFLATLEVIANRTAAHVTEAFRSAPGGFEQQLRSALAAYAELLANNPKSARVAMIDAPAAGAAGWLKLTRMLLVFERMLAEGLASGPQGVKVPTPAVRAIVGGIAAIAHTRLRERRTAQMPELVDGMLAWVLAPNHPAAERIPSLGPASRSQGAASLATAPLDAAAHLQGPRAQASGLAQSADAGAAPADKTRARLLQSALTMASLEGYANLSPLRVVDQAGVSIDTFFSVFGDIEECFLAAFSDLSAELRARVSDPGLAGAEWPLAVRRAIARLMRYLAAHPSHAYMIATGACEVGDAGVDLNQRLAGEVAASLTEGAPPAPNPELVREAVAGAVWHTIYCHAMGRKTELLPATVDYLTYVVLSQFIGGKRAMEALGEAYRRPAISSARGARRTAAHLGTAARL